MHRQEIIFLGEQMSYNRSPEFFLVCKVSEEGLNYK